MHYLESNCHSLKSIFIGKHYHMSTICGFSLQLKALLTATEHQLLGNSTSTSSLLVAHFWFNWISLETSMTHREEKRYSCVGYTRGIKTMDSNCI